MEPSLRLLMALTALSPLCNERISAGRLHAYLARYYAANTLDDSIDCEQSTLQLLTQDSVPGLDSIWRKAAGSLLEWKERLSKKNKEAGLVDQVDELSEFCASYNSFSLSLRNEVMDFCTRYENPYNAFLSRKDPWVVGREFGNSLLCDVGVANDWRALNLEAAGLIAQELRACNEEFSVLSSAFKQGVFHLGAKRESPRRKRRNPQGTFVI